jgi:hypothetical protein
MGFGDLLALGIKKIEIINAAIPMTMVPMFIVSGFTAKIKSIVIYMVVLSYLSFFRFGFQSMIKTEFNDALKDSYMQNCHLMTKCRDRKDRNCFQHIPGHPNCNPDVTYDFYETEYWHNIGILLLQAILFRILAFIAIYRFSVEKNLTNQPIPDELKQIKGQNEPQMITESAGVNHERQRLNQPGPAFNSQEAKIEMKALD